MTINDKDFQRLRDFMYNRFGLNLEKKQTLVEGRLASVVAQAGYSNFCDYLDAVMADDSGQMVETLQVKLTTNYSYFMREQGHYDFLSKTVLPEWTQKIRDHDLRIWSAGCSSGEEAYTTAMVINEFFGLNKRDWDCTVLATDISSKVLNEAKTGIYAAQRLEKLPPAWRDRYFTKMPGDMYKVKPVLQGGVVFGHFNLMDSFTRFKRKFHVIFCRNVMIYFDTPTKTELVRRFYDALEPGGYLFVGMSESILGLDKRFQTVLTSIYRKG